MDERVIQFRVGVVIVAAAMITVILIMLLGAWPNPFKSRYQVYIEFPSAPGVTVDTPVRKSGIQIGRVGNVQLKDDGRVLLTLNIDEQYKLYRSEVCRISTGSLVTGDAILEFVQVPGQPRSSQLIGDEEYMDNGQVSGDPFQVFVNLESQVAGAVNSIQRAGDDVSDLAQTMNSLVGDNEEQLQRIIGKTEIALDDFSSSMNALSGLLGDDELQEQLKKSLEQFPQVVEDIRTTLSDTRKTLEGFDRVSERAERNLANLENFTDPLAERGEEMAENLARSVRNVDELLEQLVQFSRAINSREGTLGQLVHNPELYERLVAVAANAEDASRRLRPILDDIRMFSDKIARDPRLLGVKGAVDRRPSGTGVKPLPLR